jgi:hypothetical protein
MMRLRFRISLLYPFSVELKSPVNLNWERVLVRKSVRRHLGGGDFLVKCYQPFTDALDV